MNAIEWIQERIQRSRDFWDFHGMVQVVAMEERRKRQRNVDHLIELHLEELEKKEGFLACVRCGADIYYSGCRCDNCGAWNCGD